MSVDSAASEVSRASSTVEATVSGRIGMKGSGGGSGGARRQSRRPIRRAGDCRDAAAFAAAMLRSKTAIAVRRFGQGPKTRNPGPFSGKKTFPEDDPGSR